MIRLFGIFNFEKIKNTSEFKKLYDKLNNENKIEDISSNKKNSFILISEEKENIRGFISNIGTNTIRKRKIV